MRRAVSRYAVLASGDIDNFVEIGEQKYLFDLFTAVNDSDL